MMTDTTTERLQRMAESTLDECRRLDALQDWTTVAEWLDEALDVQVSAKWSLRVDEPRTFTNREVHVLITLGGPNIWAIAGDNGWLKVEGYWGTDRVVERAYLPWLADWLQQYADELGA